MKKVKSLKEVLLQLRKKRMLSDNAFTDLEQSYAGVPMTLIKRTLKNVKSAKRNRKQIRSKFPKELRSFALTLQFYSTKAYMYVRKVFGLALPALSTIRKRIGNVKCEPGFSDTSFNFLKK